MQSGPANPANTLALSVSGSFELMRASQGAASWVACSWSEPAAIGLVSGLLGMKTHKGAL
jgi:hypothetical protein